MIRSAGGRGGAGDATVGSGPAVSWDDAQAAAQRRVDAAAEVDGAKVGLKKAQANLKGAEKRLADAEKAQAKTAKGAGDGVG